VEWQVAGLTRLLIEILCDFQRNISDVRKLIEKCMLAMGYFVVRNGLTCLRIATSGGACCTCEKDCKAIGVKTAFVNTI
jgi:hypothetical protein